MFLVAAEEGSWPVAAAVLHVAQCFRKAEGLWGFGDFNKNLFLLLGSLM